MTCKTEEFYKLLFRDLSEFAEEHNIQLIPPYIITDFEKASINAAYEEFPGVISKGCFFHLGQSGWRKIQDCSLTTLYIDNDNFSLMIKHLFALAFLPPEEIPAAFNVLKPSMPYCLQKQMM